MAKPKQRPTPTFPQTVYVTRERDPNSDDSWLTASDSPNGVDHGERVAIYELREIKTKRTDHRLE